MSLVDLIHNQDDTPPKRKSVGRAAHLHDSKRNLALNPLARRARQRVVELAVQGVPRKLIAQKARVALPEVHKIIASELEFAGRIRATFRIRWPHESMTAIERIIGDVERDCYEELEVA